MLQKVPDFCCSLTNLTVNVWNVKSVEVETFCEIHGATSKSEMIYKIVLTEMSHKNTLYILANKSGNTSLNSIPTVPVGNILLFSVFMFLSYWKNSHYINVDNFAWKKCVFKWQTVFFLSKNPNISSKKLVGEKLVFEKPERLLVSLSAEKDKEENRAAPLEKLKGSASPLKFYLLKCDICHTKR